MTESPTVTDGPDRRTQNLHAYRRDIRRLPKMNEKTTRTLLRQMKASTNDDQRAEIRNQIVEGHLALAAWAAFRFGSSRLAILDNIQIANEALLKAVNSINPDTLRRTRGFVPGARRRYGNFSSYALTAIKNALWQAVAKQSRPVVLDYSTRHKILKTQARLREELGREPDAREIADAIPGMEPERVIRFLDAWIKSVVELDAPLRDNDGRQTDETQGDYLEQSVYPAPSMGLEVRDLQRRVKGVMDSATPPLSVDERTVLRLKWGLVDNVERTNAEVAQVLNISVARTKKIHWQAMTKVRAGATLTSVGVQQLEASALWKIRQGVRRAS